MSFTCSAPFRWLDDLFAVVTRLKNSLSKIVPFKALYFVERAFEQIVLSGKHIPYAKAYRSNETLRIFHFPFSDGVIGLSILPIAALLTGSLLTIGIGVLLVVVLAIRKRRDPISRNMCDDKDKHIGKK